MFKKHDPWMLRGDIVILNENNQLKLVAEDGVKSFTPLTPILPRYFICFVRQEQY